MKTCCVYKCGACNADAVSLFRFPRDRSLRDKWFGMIGVVSFDPHNSHAVCSRHFTADLIVQAGRAARLREGAYPTLRLERPPAAKSARKLEVGRAECQEASADSPFECWHSEDGNGLSPSHGHLNVDETATIVVKKEPEEILGTPMGEDMHSEDCGRASTFPLHLDGGMDNAFAVKEELDDTSVLSTCEDFYREDTHCPFSSHDHPKQGEATSVVVKGEPDELAALHVEDEGSYSMALDPLATNQVPLEGHWSDCPLPVIEVPDEILTILTGGSSRYEDCGRVPPSQLGLEGRWSDNCVVKEEKTELPAVHSSEGSWFGLSGCKSPMQVNQEGHLWSGPVRIKREPEDTPAASPSEASDWEDTCGPCTFLEPPNEVQKAAIVPKEDPDEFAALRIDEGWGSGALGSAFPSLVQLERHQEDTPLCSRE
ncbi:unnamed protein product, partial [Ixodes pacificus]